MKNGLLIWNVLLTLLVGYLLYLQFGSNSNSKVSSKTSNVDTLGGSRTFRIAYFEMDSVEANFTAVKQIKSELSKQEDDINSELESLTRNFQQRYNYFQSQAQAGSLTQAQSEAAGQELKGMDEKIKARKMELEQKYDEFKIKKMKEIKTKIEDFLKGYNEERRYTYIMSIEPGLFYYKDSTYNITDDVIKGLNKEYSGKK